MSQRWSMFRVSIVWLALVSFRCGGGSYYLPPVMTPVRPGIEVLMERGFQPFQWKRAGLITNATGITSLGKPTVDVLKEAREIELVALFGPEHGIRGDHAAGQEVAGDVDAKTGVRVFSLYGETRKPTRDMLHNVDVLFFDIQDIGVRPYTYIYTMANCMEAAAEAAIPFVVLDRPNPLGGMLVDGNILDEHFKSFIGRYPIPYLHGMTIGELAKFFNAEFGIGCQLHVVPMSGWRRWMSFYDTGLPWVATSPHIPHARTAWHYAMTGFLGELGTVSEGVGYTAPFEYVAAPWIDADRLAGAMSKLNLPGVGFHPVWFTPFYGKFTGQSCGGVRVRVIDPRIIRPFAVGVHLVFTMAQLYGTDRVFEESGMRMFRLAAGTDLLEKMVREGRSAEVFLATYGTEVDTFLKKRKPYLLYQ